jgi:acid phosphatase type 7
MKAFCLSLFLLLSPLFAGEKAPLAVWLTWHNNPSSSMVISWITSKDDSQSEVSYGKEGSAWERKTGISRPFPGHQGFLVHEAEVAPLLPGTPYHFQIEGYPVEHSFLTAPMELKAPLTFVVGGDPHIDRLSLIEKTNREAALCSPLFAVIGGDIAQGSIPKGEKRSRLLIWLQSWYETMRTKEGHLIPLLVTIGNHDVDEGLGHKNVQDALLFSTLFSYPNNQGYEAFCFGNYLALYLLDSGNTHSIEGKQTTWLEDEMKKDQNMLYSMAVYHVPAYPAFHDFHDELSSSIRKSWVPLFDTYHLLLAFENHDHTYKRTFPLKNNAHSEDGVIYVGGGAWGAPPRNPIEASSTPYLARTEKATHFCKVEVNTQNVQVWAITEKGDVIDHFVREKNKEKSLKQEPTQ